MGNTPSAEVLMCVLKVKDCVKVKKKKKTFLLIVDFIIFSESVSEKKRKAAMEFCFFSRNVSHLMSVNLERKK